MITNPVYLQRELNRVSPHNRVLEPSRVWVMLVPLINIAWQFVIVISIPDSLRNEARERNRDDGSDHGKRLGLLCAATNCCAWAIEIVARFETPVAALLCNLIGSVLALISLVLFIIF